MPQRSNTLKVPRGSHETMNQSKPTVRYSPSVDSFTRQSPKAESTLKGSKSTGAISMFQKIFQNNNIMRHNKDKQTASMKGLLKPSNAKITERNQHAKRNSQGSIQNDNSSKPELESTRTQPNQDIYKLPKGPPPPYNKQLRHHSLDYTSNQHSKQPAHSRRFGSCDSVGSSQLTSQENMSTIHDVYDVWPGRGYDSCTPRGDLNQSRDNDAYSSRDLISDPSRDNDTRSSRDLPLNSHVMSDSTNTSRDQFHDDNKAQLGLLNIQNLARMELDTQNAPRNTLGIYNAAASPVVSPQSTHIPIEDDLATRDVRHSVDNCIWPTVSASNLGDTLCYPQNSTQNQKAVLSQSRDRLLDQSATTSVKAKTDSGIDVIIDDERDVGHKHDGVATINSHAMSYLSTDV